MNEMKQPSNTDSGAALNTTPDAVATTKEFSRKKFLLRGVQVAAAVGLSPIVARALDAGVGSSVDRLDAGLSGLNFLLSFKYLTQAFYQQALDIDGFVPELDQSAIKQISKHENGHVGGLKGLLGTAAVAIPAFDFSGGGQFNPFGDYGSFLVLASGFEDFGVRAVQGQLAAYGSNAAILGPLLEIHSTEARHAARLRELRGLRPWVSGTPGDAPQLAPIYATESSEGTVAAQEAFDEPLTQSQAYAFIAPFFA